MAENNLVPLEKYLKAGAHIGTKFKAGDMRRYVFKRRKDGLNVLDVETIDERIKIAAKFIAEFDLPKIVAVSRRTYSQTPAKEFAKALGTRALTGRFVPGTFTNPRAKEFVEPGIVIVSDAELDSQAIKETVKVKAPVVALSSTNNSLKNIDLVIPINNKGRKSLALAYWLLAREILKHKGLIKADGEFSPKLSDFEYELKEGEGEEESELGEEENKKPSEDKE